MIRLTIVLLLVVKSFPGFGQEVLEKEYQEIVVDFIQSIKQKKFENLNISFPLERQYPLPPIKNKEEFVARFTSVFDDSLVNMIIHSNPETDWSAVGWRGITLHSGVIWLDYDGQLLGVNYQSKTEQKKRNELIEQDRQNVHESLKQFVQPIHILETSEYRIRIDDLGNSGYRYASWPIKSKMSDKPDLILYKGEWIPEGSGGNNRFEFKNGDYLYVCSIIILGENDDPPAELTIYLKGKEILSEPAQLINKFDPELGKE